jgi:hypothetical protein
MKHTPQSISDYMAQLGRRSGRVRRDIARRRRNAPQPPPPRDHPAVLAQSEAPLTTILNPSSLADAKTITSIRTSKKLFKKNRKQGRNKIRAASRPAKTQQGSRHCKVARQNPKAETTGKNLK